MEYHSINQSQKEIILKIILQDLKHNQLRLGLQNIGLDDACLYSSDMFPVITELMGVAEKDAGDKLGEKYYEIIGVVDKLKISDSGETLKPLAEKCYEMLLSNFEIQNLLNSES
ncbi:MAG: hypothetical protein HRT71_12325 [Flavobacteriales bacterium]|nr:hypothetical protein [Flavobacteriales bacterium]